MTSLTTAARRREQEEEEEKKLSSSDNISSTILAARVLVETIQLMNRRIDELEGKVERLSKEFYDEEHHKRHGD